MISKATNDDSPVVSPPEPAPPACRNCAEPLGNADRFCRHCGQKTAWRRQTVRSALGNAAAQAVNFDKGLGLNLLMLFKDPGRLARDLVSGRTQPYLNVFRMVLIVTAVIVFLQVSTGVYETQQGAISDALYEAEAAARQRALQRRIKEYLSLIFLALIPFLALANYWLTRRRGFNYAEHLTVASLQTTGAMLLSTPVQLCLFYADWVSMSTSWSIMLVSFAYYAYVLRSTFALSWLAAGWRAVLSYVIAMSLFILLVSVVVAGFMFTYAAIYGGEALKAFLGQ